MIKKLTRIGDDVVLVLDKPLLEELGLDENADVELSTNGQVLVVTPSRDTARERKFRKSMDEINEKYAEVFRRLGES
jgi:antitoxin component of MazEF toxin-antitoxin module